MRRSRVLFLALATAGVFWIAGIAVGYWAIPEGKGDSAMCIVLRRQLGDLRYDPTRPDDAPRDDYAIGVAKLYDDNCR